MLIPIMMCITQIIYIAHIIRRILKTVIDRSLLDDKVRAWVGGRVWMMHSQAYCVCIRTTTVISGWSWRARCCRCCSRICSSASTATSRSRPT